MPKSKAEQEHEHMVNVLHKAKRFRQNTPRQDPLGYEPIRLPKLDQRQNSYEFYGKDLNPEELKNLMISKNARENPSTLTPPRVDSRQSQAEEVTSLSSPLSPNKAQKAPITAREVGKAMALMPTS